MTDRMKAYLDYMRRENAKDNKSLGGTDNVLMEQIDVDPLEEGARWNRLKKAWRNTGYHSTNRASQSFRQALKQPVGKMMVSGSAGAHAALFGAVGDPKAAGTMAAIGLGAAGLAAAQKGYRVAKEYRRLKNFKESTEQIDEGKRLERLKRAWRDTGVDTDDDVFDERIGGPRSVARVFKHPIGKAAFGLAALHQAHSPAVAGVGAAALGAAAIQKGYRVAKRYRSLKKMYESAEDLDEGLMDKVRRARYYARKWSGSQRRSVEAKASEKAYDHDYGKAHNPDTAYDPEFSRRRDRAAKLRVGLWRRDDQHRIHGDGDKLSKLEYEYGRIKGKGKKSQERKAKLQSEIDALKPKVDAHKKKRDRQYKWLNAYDDRTQHMKDRSVTLNRRAAFARNPSYITNPAYMGQHMRWWEARSK